MPSVATKLYSVFFKLQLKHRLQSRVDAAVDDDDFGITSRPEESTAPANPSFSADGVATKDIHIDPLTSLSLRIFLPDSFRDPRPAAAKPDFSLSAGTDAPAYRGYLPSAGVGRHAFARRLPVILQFHGGGFVSGSNTSTANDFFCRRITKLLDVIVIAVGYRLAPESRYPAAFEDGISVLHWLAKQANLAECNRSIGSGRARKMDMERYIVDAFGASTVEPWLAAHADLSRYDLSSPAYSN
ncbi:putative carboxylesterase 16 [Platanthera zijinensis]|uniref:Carboxylesterase 16 n=1 Tax=Platanthera zijinensis TaxID=2320716 RepID=A0AAP0BU15_9ASPA